MEKVYLKWGNTIVGEINKKNQVLFTQPTLNPVVRTYTDGKSQ